MLVKTILRVDWIARAADGLNSALCRVSPGAVLPSRRCYAG